MKSFYWYPNASIIRPQGFKEIAVIVSLVLSIACSTKTGEEGTLENQRSKQDKLDMFLVLADSLREKAKVPGVGITIIADNEVLFTGGLGYRDVDKKLPVTENTNFLIGSTTKAFTGTLIAMLVSREVLDWNEPIKKYIPELELSEKYIEENLTLKDALSHTTGLGRYDHLWKNSDFKRNRTLDVIKTIPFVAPFRNSYNYNNWMYVLSGLTAEKVTNRSWENLIETELLAPLSMENTHTSDAGFLNSKNRALGYKRDGITVEQYIPLKEVAPTGAISSTPKDLAKWLMMFLNGGTHEGRSFLDERAYHAIVSPNDNIGFRPPNQFWYYNAGWGGYFQDGKRNLGHDGSIEGFNAWATLKTDDGFGIFILTNQLSSYKNIIADYAERIFLKNDFSKDVDREKELIATYDMVTVKNVLLSKGITETKKFLKTIDRSFLESGMNSLGYELMEQGKLDEAKFIFRTNTIDHPESSNVFDSMGEYYYRTGELEESRHNYEKAYELDPSNSNARAMIEKLSKK